VHVVAVDGSYALYHQVAVCERDIDRARRNGKAKSSVEGFVGIVAVGVGFGELQVAAVALHPGGVAGECRHCGGCGHKCEKQDCGCDKQ